MNCLVNHGFDVAAVRDLPTALVATYKHGHGGRTHAFCCEYDALKGIGQGQSGRKSQCRCALRPPSIIACGHNLIAICGLGAGIILKEAMIEFDISGTVQVIGTPGSCLAFALEGVKLRVSRKPAEEDGGGKIALIDRGIFKTVDTCSMAHPGGLDPPMSNYIDGSCTLGGPGSLARSTITAQFFGRGAHAGVRHAHPLVAC